MRSFIAIELTPEIRGLLERIQQKLKRLPGDVKWVPANNMHLTIKFLGELAAQQVEKTAQIIESAAGQFRPFEASLSHAGAFPSVKAMRVLWMGLGQGADRIGEIASFIEQETGKHGICEPEERTFSSHVTIGRVKNKSLELVRELEKICIEDYSSYKLTVKSLVLFKSTLKPAGPVYEPYKQVNLKTA